MGKRKYENGDEFEWEWGGPLAPVPSKATKTSRGNRAAPNRKRTTAAMKAEAALDPYSSAYLTAAEDSTSAGHPHASSSSSSSSKLQPAGNDDPVPVIPKRPSKRVTKVASDETGSSEKRLARIRKSCPKNIQERLERVMTQRFFLVDRERNGTELQESFKVLGSTGNVYTIVIKHVPGCDCPDALKGNHCKHLLFVLLKVLAVPVDSPNIYQKALLTSELEEIFANAPAAATASIQHNGLQKAWAEATGSPVKETAASAGKRREPKDDDACPICFEEFEEDRGANAIVYCETSCGGPIHKQCLVQWHNTKPDATCVYCRAPWPNATGGAKAGAGSSQDGQYVNLAAAAGISPERDTSTYYHGPRREMTQRESYHEAAARYNGGRAPAGYGYEAEWWE